MLQADSNVSRRRANLTPPLGVPAPGLPPTRRGAGGARREVSERVHLHTLDGGPVLTGWALNISRGGVRAIVEDHVELGAEFDIAIGEDPSLRRGRIVWIQEEPDGAIVGVEFQSISTAPPAPSDAPPAPEE
jgi:hypothetical protein